MSLIKCPGCGLEVSARSATCARCGAGLGGSAAVAVAAADSPSWADRLVQDIPTEAQAAFYRKTYLTAGLSFLGWMFVTYALFSTGVAITVFNMMMNVSWLIVLGIFWVASHFGGKMTFAQEKGTQLAGLGIYIVAYALLFVPLITIAAVYSGGIDNAMGTVFMPAFIATLTVFGALTTVVFLSRTDFSFLKSVVVFGSFFAIGAIVIITLKGINIGSGFAIAMIVLMSATILYETHKIKTQFNTTQHIGAGAMIFASFMVMLWYMIQLFMRRD